MLRFSLPTVSVLVFGIALPVAAQRIPDGRWNGTLNLSGAQVVMVLHVVATETGQQLSMNAADNPPSVLTAVRFTGEELAFNWRGMACSLVLRESTRYSGDCTLSDGSVGELVLLVPQTAGTGKDILTRAMLVETGATDVLRALNELRPTWLRARGSARFDRVVVVNVYVDGQWVGDTSYLTLLDPESVEEIEFYTGSEATTRWGSHNTGGVIAVTRRRP